MASRTDRAGHRGALLAAGWASTAAAGLGALALLGCGGLGERADTGMCPEGEICSSSTPEGLRFYGPLLGGTLDNAAHPVAIGGSESIAFEDSRNSSFTLPPHRTVSSAPSIVEVLAASNGRAVLRGAAAGEARIRVLDTDERLLDRIAVSAQPLSSVSLAAPLLVRDDRPFAFVPGTQLVSVQLLSATGARLVDEGLVFGASSASYTVASGTWDTVELEVPASGSATLELTTVGRSFEVQVPVAGPIDDIEVSPIPVGLENLEPLRAMEGGTLCFDLLSGGATVVGADLVFAYRINDGPPDATQTSPCVGLPRGIVGVVSIEVTAGGVTREFQAMVAPATTGMSLVDGDTLMLPRWGSHGERASLLRGLSLDHLAPAGL